MVCPFLWQAQCICDYIVTVLTLVPDVMDCEYCFNVLEFLDMAVVNVDIQSYQRCLPVVCMDDIRFLFFDYFAKTL